MPVGAFGLLPQPPREKGNGFDPRELGRWFDDIWRLLSGQPGISWSVLEQWPWQRNQNGLIYTGVDLAVAAGFHVSVECTVADITITLPDPTLSSSKGMPIWIHKVDNTEFEVKTTVKDLKYQNSTMHLISNGFNWVIS